MPPDDLAVGRPNAREAVQVLALVGHEPGEADEVLRACPGLGEDLDDVAERALDLADEVVRFDLLLGVPSDLTAEEEGAPGGCGDAVRVALGTTPVGGVKRLVDVGHEQGSPLCAGRWRHGRMGAACGRRGWCGRRG